MPGVWLAAREFVPTFGRETRAGRCTMKYVATCGVFLTGLAPVTEASVLTFGFDSLSNGVTLPPGYGDNISIFDESPFNYGPAFGATPDILVDLPGNLRAWTDSYGDLDGVAYAVPDSSTLELTLRSTDPEQFVALHGFDLGGWPLEDFTVSRVQVLGADGVLFGAENVLVRGSSIDPDTKVMHTSFDFDRPLVSSEVTIRIDLAGLGFADDNIGLDNIAFAQVVPAPSSAIALLALGAVSRRRRHQR